MRHALGVLLTVSLVGPAFAAPPVGEAHVYKIVGDRKLTLHVTKPKDWKAADTRPAIVFFHGGGWVGGKPGQFTEHSKYFATRGIVCVQVQYRLLKRRGNGIDPKRIASGGGSAGGHLAAFVGMVDGLDDPADASDVSAKSNAMLLFNPVFDNGPKGYGHKRVGKRYKEFSPLHNVTKDDPPAIVFLGSKDTLIPVQTAYDFRDAMKKAGVRCEVMIFEGKPHGFFNYGRDANRAYYKTVIATDKFLASLGWIEGQPTLKKPKSKRRSVK